MISHVMGDDNVRMQEIKFNPDVFDRLSENPEPLSYVSLFFQ